jgi:hypothetical protein
MPERHRERFVYGSVLEALTKGLYPDKRHVLREFVQNAFDALYDLRRIDKTARLKPIQVRIERPSILIYDEGIGMSEQLMRQYRYVGFSEKNPLQTVGFRGIGKMSGVAVAKRLVVTSSRRGVPKRYEVVIDADGMFDRLKNQRNPVLDELLAQFSQVREEREKQDAHYTAVELQDIRQDSESLYDSDDVREYLRQTVPLPLDPDCTYATEVGSRLRSEVQHFFECELSFNGSLLFKPFPTNVLAPQFIPIFESDDDGSPLLGFCWYVKNAGKGQIEPKGLSGLTYRVKNFAVGDHSLPRENLWSSTPERAFYFYGELHLTDAGLVPTADRTDFEDNAPRQRMYERCQRISQQLNREAGMESEHRRFGEVLSLTERLVKSRREEMNGGQMDVAIRPDVQYQVRKALEEVEKRMARTKAKRTKVAKDNELIRHGQTVVRGAKGFLNDLEVKDTQLFDLKKAVPMGEEAQRMYDVVITVLREDLRSDLPVFERILRKLRERIQEAFVSAA